jgi:hypothetical protein
MDDDDDILTRAVEDDDLLLQFRDWNKELNHWGEWRDEADEAFRFVAGEQWSKEDRAAMEDARRVPMVINLTGPMVDAVVGAEINGRQEVKYEPRGMEDGGLAEFLSRAAEWVRDQCDAEVEESAAYRDAFICGLGALEGRLEYEDEPGGKIIFDRIEAGEALPDPKAVKPNAADRRYQRRRKQYSLREFRERWPHAEITSGSKDDDRTLHVDDPKDRYDDPVSDGHRREVTVDHWQWYDLETVFVVQNPVTGEEAEVSAEEIGGLRASAQADGLPFDPNPPSYKRRIYRYAFVAGSEVLDQGQIEEFSIKFVTGLRDREKKCWYGIVRRMKDPQRAINKLYSLGLHILAAGGKGGVLAEDSAIKDQKAFEESWSRHDAITKVADGSLQAGRVQQKEYQQLPPALMPLFDTALQMLREAAGINAEMLGQVDQEQPGIVEAQRKQAAYGILASFFDAFRRYRREQGRQLLRLMRYLPDGTLVRVVGEDGTAQYAPLQFNDDVAKYDVIVDETPSGPNHRERTWQQVVQMVPYLMEAQLPGEVWSELIQYSPLPESVSTKLGQMIRQASEPDPQQQAMQQQIDLIMTQLGIQDAQAEIDNKRADVTLKGVEAESKMIEAVNLAARPDPEPQSIL